MNHEDGMKYWLIGLLKKLEELIPPPKGCHHAISYARYGNDKDGWDDKLALHLNTDGVFETFFFDDDDFSINPHFVALEISKISNDVKLNSKQITNKVD